MSQIQLKTESKGLYAVMVSDLFGNEKGWIELSEIEQYLNENPLHIIRAMKK